MTLLHAPNGVPRLTTRRYQLLLSYLAVNLQKQGSLRCYFQRSVRPLDRPRDQVLCFEHHLHLVRMEKDRDRYCLELHQ